MKMVLHDPIYKKVEVTEKVLVDLLQSKALLRLKNINQFGIPKDYYHKDSFSRYDHSLGVMVLLKKLGASLDEQIAGLLHDISHTAFSHVYDWMYEKTKLSEDSQDKRHKQFILKNIELISIFNKYSINPLKIIDYKNFPLLEKKEPDLCADRVDYSLREFPKKVTNQIVPYLINFNNEIVCTNSKIAKIFTLNFLKLQQNHWAGFEAIQRYQYFSNMLIFALEEKILNDLDFFTDDKKIIQKLIKSNNSTVNNTLVHLKTKKLEKPHQGLKVIKRFRYIDPKFIDGKKLIRLSDFDKNIKKILEKAKQDNAKGTTIYTSLPEISGKPK